jgi:hypothetical protein
MAAINPNVTFERNIPYLPTKSMNSTNQPRTSRGGYEGPSFCGTRVEELQIQNHTRVVNLLVSFRSEVR